MDEAMIYRTIETAQRIRRQGGPEMAVSIHVGTDVWDWIRSKAIAQGFPLPPGTAPLFGFPLVHESLRRPDHISVRTSTIIA